MEYFLFFNRSFIIISIVISIISVVIEYHYKFGYILNKKIRQKAAVADSLAPTISLNKINENFNLNPIPIT